MQPRGAIDRLEQILVPTLQPGDIVIADTAHKVDGVRHAIEAVGAAALPPALQPRLQPHRAELRQTHRPQSLRSIDTLWPLLGDCRATPTECRNDHCGSRPPKRNQTLGAVSLVEPSTAWA